jgi:DNA-binding SARP family transcriptional activator
VDRRWRIELLGGLVAQREDRVVTRFQTQKTRSLLGYLAYRHHRSHPRDFLIELLWPECEARAGRNRLSQALSSLRHQFEPPGTPAGSVILATRTAVQLSPAAISTDVTEFDDLLRAAERVSSAVEQSQMLAEAVELYRGELLPGCFEEWIFPERERLAQADLQALRRLTRYFEQADDLPNALNYARRAVAAEPLCEEARQELIRLLAAAGQPEAALRQYLELERLFE